MFMSVATAEGIQSFVFEEGFKTQMWASETQHIVSVTL